MSRHVTRRYRWGDVTDDGVVWHTGTVKGGPSLGNLATRSIAVDVYSRPAAKRIAVAVYMLGSDGSPGDLALIADGGPALAPMCAITPAGFVGYVGDANGSFTRVGRPQPKLHLAGVVLTVEPILEAAARHTPGNSPRRLAFG